MITEQSERIKEAIVVILHDVFDENTFADKAIEFFFRNNRITENEIRETIAVGVYEILRKGGILQYLSKSDDTEQIVQYWFDNREVLEDLIKNEAEKMSRQERLSVTSWLDAFAASQLGESYDNIFTSFYSNPLTYLRTNTLVTSPEQLIQELKDEGIESTLVENNTLVLQSSKDLFRTKAFAKGCFEVQDIASQKVAEFCDVKPAMRVIDACAGAGGKSLHLAALMKNRGRVLALDIYQEKLESLKERAKRAKASIIETRLITSTKTIKRLDESADRVLLDAPCSGSGVYRRNPDAKWRLSQEDITSLVKTQDDILFRYSRMTKKGGLLIYVVCSVFPCEGEERIQHFLQEKGEEFTLVEECRISPLKNCDGFYMAKMKRE